MYNGKKYLVETCDGLLINSPKKPMTFFISFYRKVAQRLLKYVALKTFAKMEEHVYPKYDRVNEVLSANVRKDTQEGYVNTKCSVVMIF